jgi:hypothetical protein
MEWTNMKILSLMVAFVGLATVALAQETSGPFGLRRGMTQEQVIQIVGNGAVKETKGDTLVLLTVPKPHPDFELYSLIFSPTDGLLKVMAIGKDISTNGFGEAVRSSFREIRNALLQTYGKPNPDLDFVRAGSIWKEPEDWMMGLRKDERYLESAWQEEKLPLPNQIHVIVLEAKALSTEKGFLELSYEFNGWDAYLDALKKKASTVF